MSYRFRFLFRVTDEQRIKNQKTLKRNLINFRFFQNGSTIKFWKVYWGKSGIIFLILLNEERYGNRIIVVFQATDIVIE